MNTSELWIATFNPHKIQEYRHLLSEKGLPFAIHTANEIPGYSAPPETGTQFVDNARIKANSLAATKPQVWVMAEDSGLVVPGLGGLPGVHSARYAGEKASDSENVAKLLKMLQLRGVQDRSAHFHCTMIIKNPQGVESVFVGELKGKIHLKPEGQFGFGYDPVFIPDGENQTLAQLGPAFKMKASHRALAFQKWLNSTTEGT